MYRERFQYTTRECLQANNYLTDKQKQFYLRKLILGWSCRVCRPVLFLYWIVYLITKLSFSFSQLQFPVGFEIAKKKLNYPTGWNCVEPSRTSLEFTRKWKSEIIALILNAEVHNWTHEPSMVPFLLLRKTMLWQLVQLWNLKDYFQRNNLSLVLLFKKY